MTTFARNLKRLRLHRGLTQEQAAESLGVSAQSVSRWECASTLPDVTLLPEIARLYCAAVDDLFREDSPAYENYAQRLGSIYEASRRLDDFLRADMEYRRLQREGNLSMEDLRLWGILWQYLMQDSRDKALSLFDQALARAEAEDPDAWWRTQRQRLLLQAQAGLAQEALVAQRDSLARDPANVQRWICLIAACQNAGAHSEAEESLRQALRRFPENAALLVYGGDVYRSLGRGEEALSCWDRAMAIDPSYLDALYAKADFLEEQGRMGDACAVWQELIGHLEKRGFDAELTYPQKRLKACRARCGDQQN